MLDVYTVSFFGHRQIDRFFETEEKVAALVRKLITEKEYVEFLIGRDGEFDQIVASTVRRAKRDIRDDNCELIWVLAYPKAEYANNADSFDEYYDSVELCDEALGAIQRQQFRSVIGAWWTVLIWWYAMSNMKPAVHFRRWPMQRKAARL